MHRQEKREEAGMIIFEHVSKFVLTDVDLCIPRGQVVGVIGRSGAGKTTLLKLVCGLLEPQEGRVYTDRRDPVKARRLLGRKMAAVFEGIPVLGEYDSVRVNFENLRDIYGIGREEFVRRYAQLGELLGFLAYDSATVQNLSLGQKRRAELGAVFLREPELIVLDEPEIGLDQNAKSVFQQLLRERKDAGATILVSSHDMDEVAGLCGRILLLDRGQIFFYGEKEMLLRKYAPMDVCVLDLADGEGWEIPNFEDLPIAHYELEKNRLTILFNSNHISAAELLDHVMAQTKVLSVTVRKGDLVDSVKAIADYDKRTDM